MPLPYSQNKKHIYKWVENNRERFREIDNRQKKRAYAWKKIKIEFFNILLI